ncbi:uncharacterized protein Dana_GF21805 [Drosophila ananassae]|uniref:Uncharacterized protein n=1 Tax=Drosophila ananassae TaxID=7217 RepID=B3N096_DROAN|nr:uncharacterized protein Dana_GF21805 [Drosophila ananassae]
MYKYLAGIFAKKSNEVVNGRITSPLTSAATRKPKSTKRPTTTNPKRCREVNPVPKTDMSSKPDSKPKQKPKPKGNPQVKRTLAKANKKNRPLSKVEMDPDPVSYITSIRATSSSNDMRETIYQSVAKQILESPLIEGNCLLQLHGVIPPPTSPVLSWTSFKTATSGSCVQDNTEIISDQCNDDTKKIFWFSFPEEYWFDDPPTIVANGDCSGILC